MAAVTLETTIKARPEVKLLAIDLVRMVVDFEDPIDGICSAPLLCDEGTIPDSKEITASIEAVLGDVA